MSESQDQKRETLSMGLVLSVLLPILYFLSVGPVVWLMEKMRWSSEWAKSFYAPIIWLHDNTFLREPLERYGQLFGW